MKPQEVLVALKLLANGRKKWNYLDASESLKISTSTLHNSIKGLSMSGLYDEDYRSLKLNALEEFLIHGVRYVFPVKPGPVARGMPTAHSAPFFINEIMNNDDSRYVWPYQNGQERGLSIEPLYRTVPFICSKDQKLYEILAVVDVIRIGRAREKEKALERLKGFINKYDTIAHS